MHYDILVALSIPKLQDEPATAKKIADAIKKFENQKDKPVLSDFYESRLISLKSAFARAVAIEADSLMDRYALEPNNRSFMVFEDQTASIERMYQNDGIDCIKTPDGRILRVTDPSLLGKYEIRDGSVYKSDWGALHQRKITKISRKMTVFPNYPFSKLYSSLSEYAEKEELYAYHEDQQAYGYYYNPNAFFDWYTIGGQWSQLFLVKESCTEFSLSLIHSPIEILEVPEGYRWVCAARKKDIEWQLMRDFEIKRASDQFRKLEKFYTTGEREDGVCGVVTEDGVEFREELIFRKDESLEEYLTRTGDGNGVQYSVRCSGFVQEDKCTERDAETEEVWSNTVSEFISSLADEAVLVGLDCHI